MGNINNLDIKSDKWVLDYKSSLGDQITFNFDFMPNEWFKKIHKEATIECLIKKKPSIETMQRYNYSFRHFFDFLTIYNINLETYQDITNNIIQLFVFYLKQLGIANSTANVVMASIKWIINHGLKFEYDFFPVSEVFDGDEYQSLRVDDVLKTKIIPDQVLDQIEKALYNEEDVLFKSLMIIGIDTGIRISEALDLELDCLKESFNGSPILHVINKKNGTERWIPVTNRVRNFVQNLEVIKKDRLSNLEETFLNVTYVQGKGYKRLSQGTFRSRILKFVEKHRILASDNTLFNLNYHAFRHTLGTHMLNKGMSIFEIQDYLGHESLHSTAQYAKILNPKVISESKKLGFVGMIVKNISREVLGNKVKIDNVTLRLAALPDGSCKKPLNDEGLICKNLNLCLLCPKFITTPEHLPIHKRHLERLNEDKEKYMSEEYIGTYQHLTTIEESLREVINQLEAMNYVN